MHKKHMSISKGTILKEDHKSSKKRRVKLEEAMVSQKLMEKEFISEFTAMNIATDHIEMLTIGKEKDGTSNKIEITILTGMGDECTNEMIIIDQIGL